MHRSASLLALVATVMIASCTGGAATSPAGNPSAAAAATTAPAAPPSGSSAPSASSAGNGTALCAFLEAEIPAMAKAGSAAGADSILAIDYANWISGDKSRVLPDAAAMDTLTKASCPSTRTNVLKLIGAGSFANGF